MRFLPVISISLGFFVFFILSVISLVSFNILSLAGFILLLILIVFAGFLATYLAEEKKMRYGFIVGIPIIFVLINFPYIVAFNSLISDIILVFLFASFGGFVGKMTDEINRQSFKTDYMGNGISPILTIIAGFVVVLLPFGIFILSSDSFTGILFIIVSNFFLILGGFIATYFAKERKIRYGIYVGIGLIILYTLSYLFTKSHLNYYLYNDSYWVLLFTFFGGFVGKITDKNQLHTGFSPISAIVSGLVIGLLCYDLLWSITGIIVNVNYSFNSFGIINVAFGVISVVIGAFVTTFLAKEKKIRYGIYFGIILIIFWVLDTSFEDSINHIIIHENYYIHLGVFIITNVLYFFSAVIGGYLGIMADKKGLKQRLIKIFVELNLNYFKNG